MSSRAPHGGRRQGEQGLMALALAITVSAVLMVLAGLLFSVTTSNAGDATFQLQSSQALYAAESGLDLAYAAIGQATGSANLPCGSNALTTAFTTAPRSTSVLVSVWYYDTFPVTDGVLGCSSVTGGSVAPAAALIESTGTARQVNRYMSALVKLTPSVTGSTFDKALFSQAGITGSNSPTIYGYHGDDANVYTNANVACGNGFDIQGSVTSQGAFSASNNCTIGGNVVAVGNVSLSNNATIGGNLSSTGSSGCSAQGTITMANNATVDQSAYAYCTITKSNNAKVVQNTVPNDTTLTDPAVESFPLVPEPTGIDDGGAQAAWQAAGYTVVTDNTCSGSGSIYSAIGGYTSPTVVMTTCALSWSNNSSISLQTNVAIFSTGGFTMSNNTSWQSDNSTTRLLYLIVPSSVSGTPTTCSNGNPGITFSNNTSFASTVNVLDYTPCTLTISNNSTGYGQLYGGAVSVQNNFTEHFVPLPTVPGSSGGGQVNGPLAVGIVYERQTTSPPSSP